MNETTGDLVAVSSPSSPALADDLDARIAAAMHNVGTVAAGKLAPATRTTYRKQWATFRAWAAANLDYLERFADIVEAERGERPRLPRFAGPVDLATLEHIADAMIETGDYRRQQPPPTKPTLEAFTADLFDGDEDAADEALEAAQAAYREALPYWLATQRRLPEIDLGEPLDPYIVLLHVRDLVDLRTVTDSTGEILEGTARCTSSTLSTRLSSIVAVHKAAGHPSPVDDHGPLGNFLAGARRALRSPNVSVISASSKGEADPVDAGDLRVMIEHLDLESEVGLRDRAMLLVGFAAMLRRSEIAALRVRDIETSDGRLVVTVTDTKNHAEPRSTGILAGTNPATCPVRALTAYLEHVGHAGDANSPLFRSADGRGVGINGHTVNRAVTRAARRAALPGHVSAHSLRRGGATAHYATSKDVIAVTEAGRWAPNSASVWSYIRASRAADTAVALGL